MAQDDVAVYTWQLFANDTDFATNAQWAQAFASSGFTTVILWTVHVSPEGDLYYNDPDKPLVTGGQFSTSFQHLNDNIASLKAGGVRQVLFCVGSAVNLVDDFADIENLIGAGQLPVLEANFAALSNALPVLDGYDVDDESTLQPLAKFTEMLSKQKPVVTYSPYRDEGEWIPVLQQVHGDLGSQPVQAFHLQCYGGGAGTLPSSWIEQLQTSAGSIGVTDPAAFVIPGVDTANGPIVVQDEMTALAFDAPGIGGGFLWPDQQGGASIDFSSATASFVPSAYAAAVVKGLALGRTRAATKR